MYYEVNLPEIYYEVNLPQRYEVNLHEIYYEVIYLKYIMKFPNPINDSSE
jgi:hypothetical protein